MNRSPFWKSSSGTKKHQKLERHVTIECILLIRRLKLDFILQVTLMMEEERKKTQSEVKNSLPEGTQQTTQNGSIPPVSALLKNWMKLTLFNQSIASR